METQKQTEKKLYRIGPKKTGTRVVGDVFAKGRILLGRSESCDLIIDHDSVSAIHAVMEIFDGHAKIYDMNSTNGTWVGSEKVVVRELKIGDSFALADVEMVLTNYQISPSLPPVLDALEPSQGKASTKVTSLQAFPTRQLPDAPTVANQGIPEIVYPLEMDPKADSTEYIFENAEMIYPIFKYEAAKQSVEVIILHRDRVFSVDYLPSKDASYSLVGFGGSNKELEFAYLGKTEKLSFVEIRSGNVNVHKIPGYEVFHLSDNQAKNVNQGMGTIQLNPQDILRFSKGDLQIYLRNVEAPPKVAMAPILKRDPEFQRYLFLFLLLSFVFSASLQMIQFEEEEKEDEKAPERLATILYKQQLQISKHKAVEKTEKAPPQIQKAPPKPVVKKEEAQPAQPVPKPDVMNTEIKNQKPDPGTKLAPEKKVVVKGDPKLNPTKKVLTAQSGSAGPKTATAARPATTSRFESASKGPVDVYKSADFSSSVNTMLAKGGSLSGVKTQAATGSSTDFGGGALQGSGSGKLKTAEVSSNVGSLTGAATGVIGNSKGAEGLSAKKSIYTAGIPSETVVLGSYDPDVIRRILLDHLPQFRYCYQSELERSGQELQGVIRLAFTIGASGHVSQAGVDGQSGLPADVKRCVVGVLRGIQFPEPPGAGIVEVKQPMNFYPKKI